MIRVSGNNVGVTHQQQRRCSRIGTLNASDKASSPRRRVVTFEFESGALEKVFEHRCTSNFSARLNRSVVDASVTNQRLQKFRAFFFTILRFSAHDANSTSRTSLKR